MTPFKPEYLLLLLPLPFASFSAGADVGHFAGRKALFKCENAQKESLLFFDRREKGAVPPGLVWKAGGKIRSIELKPSKDPGSKATSDIFKFEGFMKIVHETEVKDDATSETKKELVKVLIDPDKNDKKGVKHTATLEVLTGDKLDQPELTAKFNCTKALN